MATELDTGLWLRRFSEAPLGAPRLVCFPHAGGAASWYQPFARHFEGRAELVAVGVPRPPGPVLIILSVAFTALFERLPALRLAVPESELQSHPGGRLAGGLEKFPLTW